MYWEIVYQITLNHRHKLEMDFCTGFVIQAHVQVQLFVNVYLLVHKDNLYTCIVICVMYLCMYTHFVYSYAHIIYR